jgi:hypothetical protein
MLQNMVAVQNQETRAHIGHLFWYSIGDDLYSRSLLEQTLVRAGLSLSYMPNEIRPVDAFRRATKEVETSLNQGNGLQENYITRDVYYDPVTAVRHIVKETVDSKGKRLSYNENEAILTLDKKADAIHFSADPNSYAWKLCEEAVRLFEVFKEHHNGQAVRGMVQAVLKTLSPTPVRPSGGVYFIPAVHDRALCQLVQFCSSFAKGEGFKIPVVNSEESVRMVETKVKDHLDSLLGQCRQALQDGSIPKAKLAELINETKNVVAGYRDYEEIIQKSKQEIDGRIEIIRDALSLLMDKVKAGENMG